MTHTTYDYVGLHPDSRKHSVNLRKDDVLDVVVTFNDLEFTITVTLKEIHKSDKRVELETRVVARTDGLVIL
jgi:hypothetical protein